MRARTITALVLVLPVAPVAARNSSTIVGPARVLDGDTVVGCDAGGAPPYLSESPASTASEQETFQCPI